MENKMIDIRAEKLKYYNKVEKANNILSVTDEDLIGVVNRDFYEDTLNHIDKIKSICNDYLELHKFMLELDKHRVNVTKALKEKHKSEVDYLVNEYDLLLEQIKQLQQERDELLKFKAKFTQDAKVTRDVINRVRSLKAEGLTHLKVAEIVGVSNCTVSKIMRGYYDDKGVI